MKSFAVIAVLASVAAAQLPDIPKCAINCFISALSSDGCSSLTDFKCHCGKPELISNVQPCVQKACSPAEQEQIIQDTVKICKDAGVPISIPPPAGGSQAPPASSAPAPTGGAPPASSEAPPAGGYSTPAAPSSYPTPPAGGNGTVPTSTYDGAASQITQAGAILAGLAFAVAAM